MNSGGETMEQIIHEMQDMTYLSWAKTRNSSGTAGSFLKAYEEGTEGSIIGSLFKNIHLFMNY